MQQRAMQKGQYGSWLRASHVMSAAGVTRGSKTTEGNTGRVRIGGVEGGVDSNMWGMKEDSNGKEELMEVVMIGKVEENKGTAQLGGNSVSKKE